MLCIKSTIYHILQNIGCSGYVITPADVRIAVTHLKFDKGDDIEGFGTYGPCYEH